MKIKYNTGSVKEQQNCHSCLNCVWEGTNEKSKRLQQRQRLTIGACLINFVNKKWWWSVFGFSVDLVVSKAYQLYLLQPLQPEQKPLNLLGFRREIVDFYPLDFHNTKKIWPYIFLPPQKWEKVIADIMIYNIFWGNRLTFQAFIQALLSTIIFSQRLSFFTVC